jgi:chromosome segregation protein
LGLDRLRLDLESEVRRAEATIADLRLQMDREGFTLDQSGRVLPVSEEAETDPNAVDVAPVIHGAADIDPVAIDARIEDLRRKIRRLGPVNDEAPEDFDELSERHTFLSSQLADLDRAEAQLRAAIAELNEEIRARFTTTFERVNTSFGEYFEAFFGGGSASLGLTDPENVAESGIEIEAQPPGKRLRSLSLLSGGERSLTAVALLFALLTANPAPFCVLDEVDAALDEANVGRFTSALKELAQKTQFLVVTHNRRTVEIADAIYGVSMMRDGVSKVLSLRIGDLQAD